MTDYYQRKKAIEEGADPALVAVGASRPATPVSAKRKKLDFSQEDYDKMDLDEEIYRNLWLPSSDRPRTRMANLLKLWSGPRSADAKMKFPLAIWQTSRL
jgi:hypothetical protein